MTNDTLFISTIDKEIYSDLNLGDYVTHVNEQRFDEYLKEKAKLISMSYFSQNRLSEIIQITNDSIQNWTFHSKKGTFNSEIKFSPNRLSNFSQESPPVISLNTFYIDPSLITWKELNETLKNHLGASQWILDLRKTTKNLKSFEILEEFISKKNYHFANLIIPNKYRAGTFQSVKQKTNGSNLYHGRVFVIVGSRTMSSAEYLTMALQSNPNVITIGEKTAGANGDVIEIPMPLNYSLRFSSIGVIYPDGKITQGEGIRIDEKFQPTVSQYLRSSDPIFDYLLKKMNE
jgi:C-terminal processing protease CtpA/Prc